MDGEIVAFTVDFCARPDRGQSNNRFIVGVTKGGLTLPDNEFINTIQNGEFIEVPAGPSRFSSGYIKLNNPISFMRGYYIGACLFNETFFPNVEWTHMTVYIKFD